MKTTDGYRRGRRPVVTLCALGMGWSTAQVELKSLSLGPLGTIDFSSASIPIVLTLGIMYFMVRYTLEFAMQPREIRRWRLARTDYIITLRLVQFTLLLLAGGSLYRSIETFAHVGLAAIAVLATSFMGFLGTMFLITLPITVFRRKRQGRLGVVAWIAEAEGWALLMVVIVQVALIGALAIASVRHPLIVAFWPTPPTVSAASIFGVLASIVVLSVYAELVWRSKLFASHTEQQDPDSTADIRFRQK